MTKRYRITKKHSVYGNDLKILSSAIKYREKELLDYPIEAMGKELIRVRDMSEATCDNILRSYI